MTSINDVEFKKQLFKENKREKYSEKYKSNSSNSNNYENNNNNNSYNNINNSQTKKNNLSHVNDSNNTETNIRDFNKNIFNNCEMELNENRSKEYQEKMIKNANEDINYLLSSNNSNFNNNFGPKNQYQSYMNIEENEDNLADNIYNINSKEFNDNDINNNENDNYENQNENYYNDQNNNINYLNYNNQNNSYTPNNKNYNNYVNVNKQNLKSSEKSQNLRKFYLNYNHLNTPGVYETTASNMNTEEDDAMRRSKYKLIDKNKLNNNNNNNNIRNIVYKKINRSLPNIELENMNSQRAENPNEMDYIMTNRTIKIPKRYLSENLKNKELEKKFKPLTPEEEEESRLRIWQLLQNFYSFIEESKMDPILDTFKNNEILQEFFVQRILELIANIFDSEKEMYIQKLLIEKKEHENNFKETQNTYVEVNFNYYFKIIELNFFILNLNS